MGRGRTNVIYEFRNRKFSSWHMVELQNIYISAKGRKKRDTKIQ